MPPCFRGRVVLDAALPDTLTRSKYRFGRSVASIWSPSASASELAAAEEPTACRPDYQGTKGCAVGEPNCDGRARGAPSARGAWW